MRNGAMLFAVLVVGIAFSQIEEIPTATEAEAVAPDVVEEVQNNKIVAYEQNKIIIKIGSKMYESADEWKIYAALPQGISIYDDTYWHAYRGGTVLKEDNFFEITSFPEKALRIRDLKTTYRIMKWCSPFLIMGGVLISGFSSQWGSGETNTFTPIGVGVSVLGMIAGIEGMSKESRNVFGMKDAIPAMGAYNERLKDSLGLIDTIVQSSVIQTMIDTSGIEVVPYIQLDEGLQPRPVLDTMGVPPGIPYFFKTLVLVQALIDTTGKVAACDILKTSGIKRLDSEVLRHCQEREFTIPRKDGKPVFTTITIPVVFNIRND